MNKLYKITELSEITGVIVTDEMKRAIEQGRVTMRTINEDSYTEYIYYLDGVATWYSGTFSPLKSAG